MNNTSLPFYPSPPVILDIPNRAFDWAAVAGNIWDTVGLLIVAILSLVQHIRQQNADKLQTNISTAQTTLMQQHQELHQKIDNLTPQTTPNPSNLEVSHEEEVVELKIPSKQKD